MSTVTQDEADRRPIRSRNSAWARAISSYLVARRVSPNTISLWSMAAGISAGGMLFLTRFDWAATPSFWIAAVVLIYVRLMANMLDGMVATGSRRRSRLGEFLNDAPDRVSDVSVLVGAGYAAGGSAELGLAAACVALFVAYVRVAAKGTGVPSDFRGPMAKQHRMHLIAATSLAIGLAGFLSIDNLLRWGPDARWDAIAAALAVVTLGGIITAARRWIRVTATLERLDRGDSRLPWISPE